MQYGFFDDKRKEYVIETPATPMPWINYLGSQEFFSLIKRKIKRPGAPPSIPWIGRWTVTAAVMVWATPFLRRRRTAFTRS